MEEEDLHQNDEIDITKLYELLSDFFQQKPKKEGHENRRNLDDNFAALFVDNPTLRNDLNQLLPDYRADNARQDGVRDTRPSDIKDRERCTPSYCLLPEDYQIPLASNRTVPNKEVLNDRLVAVTSGSKDYPSGNPRKNKYEHSLFRCEDRRFELDMLIESANEAIIRVNTLLEGIEKRDIPIRLEDHLTAGDIRCIKSLYGERWSRAKDNYQEKPSLYLPNLLNLLKKKKEMWGKCRTDFNAACAEEYAKCHHRSLDYRSSDFKKWEMMKGLTTKALLAEIEKKSGMESKKEDVLSCSSDGKEQHISTSKLELEYSDSYIHDDIYFLFRHNYVPPKYSVAQQDKAVNFWKNFMEHMLCVLSREAEESVPSVPTREAEESVSSVLTREADSEAEESVPSVLTREADSEAEESVPSVLTREADSEAEESVPSVPTREADSEAKENDSRLFFGYDAFYFLFMLHYILYQRLEQAKDFSCSAANTWKICNGKDSTDCYARFLCALFTLLEGGIDQDMFEDECLTILGPESYMLFTLDKLLYRIFDQVHFIVNTEINCKTIKLYEQHKSTRNLRASSTGDNNYIETVWSLLPHKRLFRLEYKPGEEELSIQLMKSAVLPTLLTQLKQNRDIESLSSKALLAEAESKKEDQLLSDGKGQQILFFQSELQYSDPDIHHNTYLLIRRSFESKYGPEHVGKFMNIWNHFLKEILCLPTRLDEDEASAHRISADGDNDSRLFYGDESFFVLIKLYSILYERVQKAKLFSCSAAKNDKDSEDRYARFFFVLINLMDGNIDQEKFEDECLTILGPESYILSTLDKLLLRIVNQIHGMAKNEIYRTLMELFEQETARKPYTEMDDNNYMEQVGRLLPDMNLLRRWLPDTYPYRGLVLYSRIIRLEYMPATARLHILLMKFCTCKADEEGTDGVGR